MSISTVCLRFRNTPLLAFHLHNKWKAWTPQILLTSRPTFTLSVCMFYFPMSSLHSNGPVSVTMRRYSHGSWSTWHIAAVFCPGPQRTHVESTIDQCGSQPSRKSGSGTAERIWSTVKIKHPMPTQAPQHSEVGNITFVLAAAARVPFRPACRSPSLITTELSYQKNTRLKQTNGW